MPVKAWIVIQLYFDVTSHGIGKKEKRKEALERICVGWIDVPYLHGAVSSRDLNQQEIFGVFRVMAF